MHFSRLTLRNTLIIILTAVCALLTISLLSACKADDDSVSGYYTVTYVATQGGTIVGETVQEVAHGGDALPVTAVADKGYTFDKWSDGVADATRQDTAVDGKFSVVAMFVKLSWSITYTANNFYASNISEPLEFTAPYGSIIGMTVQPSAGFKFVGWSDGVKSPTRIDDYSRAGETIEAIFEIEYLDLPVMVVQTENLQVVNSKEEYLNCTVTVENTDKEYCFENAAGKIRGRGNTTWSLSKKPYKLKFDSKTDLFGNGKAKKWNLIANYTDISLIRNYLAYSLAGEQGLLNNARYTTATQFVELYLNGEYCGVYLVCEDNEVGSTRVDIDDGMYDAQGNITVDTGYLLERDQAYAASEGILDQDYFEIYGKIYAIKSPDTEEKYFIEHKSEFVQFIKGKTLAAVDALFAEKTAENYQTVLQLIDVDSFVDGYILDELVNTADGEYSSFFLFYDNKDGKFHRGPVWDYDASMGNAAYSYNVLDPEAMRFADFDNPDTTDTWYINLLQYEGFRQAVSERLQAIEEEFSGWLENEIQFVLSMSRSFERNFERWDILGKYVGELAHWTTEELRAIDTWQGQVEFVKDWLNKAFAYLVAYYN